MIIKIAAIAFAPLLLVLTGMSCTPSKPNELDKLGTVDMTIKGEKFRLWIADEQSEQIRGLMYTSAEDMADLPDGTKRGMIFVFSYEQQQSFWMRNVEIPLDIAYAKTDGTVTATYTMAAFDDRLGQHKSNGPVRIAIEVNAGVWSQLGLSTGDTLDLPDSLLNPGS